MLLPARLPNDQPVVELTPWGLAASTRRGLELTVNPSTREWKADRKQWEAWPQKGRTVPSGWRTGSKVGRCCLIQLIAVSDAGQRLYGLVISR